MATVFIPTQLRDLTGGVGQVVVEGESVAQLIERLEEKFPGVKQRLCQGDSLMPGLQVSVDHVMTTRGLKAKVKPGSEVHFLPAFGGG